MNGSEAFSNGSEFEIWQDTHCAVCEHDRAFRERGYDGNDGCEVLARGMMNDEVPEWTQDPDLLARRVWPNVVCANFTPTAPTHEGGG